MKELVQVNNGQLVISSRDVADMIGKQHSHLCRDIASYIEVLSKNPKLDSSKFFVKSSYQQAGNGKDVTCYLLTKKGCDMVANKMTGEKGVLFSATYIEKFYEMENQLKPALPNFSDPAEAARAWANEYEAKQKALAQVAEMKPKADFYDDVTGSEDTIDIKSVAKVLHVPKMGRNKLFAFLRDKNILNRRNEPYQYFVDKGYFRQVESSWELDGTVHINLKTVVFQKGVEFIKKLLLENGMTPTENVV